MQVKIEKLTQNAIGLAHTADGKILFVPQALPGEEVFVKKFSQKKGYFLCEDFETVKESELRIKSSCPYSNICGGCDFDFVSPKDSAYLKEEIVKDNITRISKLNELPPFLPPAYSDNESYRARCRIHVSLKDKKAGFLKKDSNELIPINSCPRLENKLNEEVFLSDDFLKRNRGLMFQKGVNRKTGLVELSLFCGNDKISVENEEVVRSVDNIKYHVSANVFFQSNLLVLPELFNFVRENVVGNKLMDLYSGVGTFSALFENSDKELIAVERQKECLRLSQKNAPSAKSITDDVFKFASKTKTHVDTVIVDPPRVGLDKGVPELIMSFKPERIIYISCDSVTLARDIPLFSNYRISKARIFDFYYASSHCESAVVLDRIN
ncbi:MAG: class I SAM-dependent RNA methyltransferase [Spirochaetales bacterium]|nr:class I SAM-dependent RNA methyltransferase [Spirochaetales bacterium]